MKKSSNIFVSTLMDIELKIKILELEIEALDISISKRISGDLVFALSDERSRKLYVLDGLESLSTTIYDFAKKNEN
jgi:hypothetical protein